MRYGSNIDVYYFKYLLNIIISEKNLNGEILIMKN